MLFFAISKLYFSEKNIFFIGFHHVDIITFECTVSFYEHLHDHCINYRKIHYFTEAEYNMIPSIVINHLGKVTCRKRHMKDTR